LREGKRIAPLPWKREAPLRGGGRFWPATRRVRLAEHYHHYYCFTEGST
jgi:hypothetical protein